MFRFKTKKIGQGRRNFRLSLYSRAIAKINPRMIKYYDASKNRKLLSAKSPAINFPSAIVKNYHDIRERN